MKYTKGYRNLSFRSDNYKGPKGLTDGFYWFINSRKRSTFVTDSQSNESTFTAVKRNAKLSSKQATIGDKIVETLYLNRVTSENKRIRTPPLSPPFKVGVFVVFYR